MSYRALFSGILDAGRLDKIKDRKGGIGSAKQLEDLFKYISENNKWEDLKKRLEIFLDYLYSDMGFLIAFKMGKIMELHIFDGKSFVECIMKAAEKPENLTKIINRWENNNIRIKWPTLLDCLKNLNYVKKDGTYNEIKLDFCTIPDNNPISKIITEEKENVNKKIQEILRS